MSTRSAGRGHGLGPSYTRGLSDSLADSRRRKIAKKVARLLAHPHSLTAADRAWIAKHAQRSATERGKRLISTPAPVETLQ